MTSFTFGGGGNKVQCCTVRGGIKSSNALHETESMRERMQCIVGWNAGKLVRKALWVGMTGDESCFQETWVREIVGCAMKIELPTNSDCDCVKYVEINIYVEDASILKMWTCSCLCRNNSEDVSKHRDFPPSRKYFSCWFSELITEVKGVFAIFPLKPAPMAERMLQRHIGQIIEGNI